MRAQGKQEGGKCEPFKGEKQEAGTQNTQDTDNTDPTVMGNNNKELIAETKDNDCTDFLSELLNNQSLISGTEIEDDTMAIDMQINCDSNNLISESLINQSSIVVKEKENDMTIEKENNMATKKYKNKQ